MHDSLNAFSLKCQYIRNTKKKSLILFRVIGHFFFLFFSGRPDYTIRYFTHNIIIPAAEYNVGNQSVTCMSCVDTRGFCWKCGVQMSDALLTPPCHSVFLTCGGKQIIIRTDGGNPKYHAAPDPVMLTYAPVREIGTPVGGYAHVGREIPAGVVERRRPVVRHHNDYGVVQNFFRFERRHHATHGFVQFRYHRCDDTTRKYYKRPVILLFL